MNFLDSYTEYTYGLLVNLRSKKIREAPDRFSHNDVYLAKNIMINIFIIKICLIMIKLGKLAFMSLVPFTHSLISGRLVQGSFINQWKVS